MSRQDVRTTDLTLTGSARRILGDTTISFNANVDERVRISQSGTGVGGVLQIGPAATQIIRNPASGAANLSVESTNGYAFLSAGLNAHLSSNTYFDGAAWNRYATANPGSYLGVNNTSVSMAFTAAGANPAAFTTKFTFNGASSVVMTFGSDTVSGAITIGPTYGIIMTTSGNLYLRTSGSTNAVVMDTGSGGLVVSAGPVNAGTYVQATNGYYYFVNNTIQLFWNGQGLQSTHYIMSNGNMYARGGYQYLGSADNAALYWNGGGVRCSTYFMVADNPMIYFDTGTYYLQRNGAIMQFANLNVLSWGWIGFSGNSGINISWDGTYLAHTHQIKAPHLYIPALAGQIKMNDGAWIIGTNPANGGVGYVQYGLAVGSTNHNSHVLWSQGLAGGTTAWDNTSSEKIKTNIQTLDNWPALLRDDTLRGLYYQRTDLDGQPWEYGFSADKWHPKVPEVVTVVEDEPFGMTYTSIIPILWEAVRSLLKRVDDLEGALP